MSIALSAQTNIARAVQEMKKRKARNSFIDFVKYTYNGEYQDAWFHRYVAKKLEDLIFRRTDKRFLMLFMPPRHGKSELVSRNLPPFYFGNFPDHEIISTTYAQTLSNAMSLDVQRIMTGDKYGDLFPDVKLAISGIDKKFYERQSAEYFDIVNHKGHYLCAGVGGAITGRGGNLIIIDDPVKNRQDAESETVRETVLNWYKSTLRTRLMPDGVVILLMTRWHENDLAGEIINQMRNEPDADQWEIVEIPASYEASEYAPAEDTRTDGQPLWPTRYDESALKRIKATLGSYDWYALFQQKPRPSGGAVIKREWLQQILKKAPDGLSWVRGYDLAVTASTKADKTSSIKMAIDAAQNIFLSGGFEGQWEWPTVKKLIGAVAKREVIPVGIEAVGTQKAFVQDLQSDDELMHVAITGYNVTKDKLTRALPWVARAEAGKLYLIEGEWVDKFIDIAVRFTGTDGEDDNMIDAISICYTMLCGGGENAIAGLGNLY